MTTYLAPSALAAASAAPVVSARIVGEPLPCAPPRDFAAHVGVEIRGPFVYVSHGSNAIKVRCAFDPVVTRLCARDAMRIVRGDWEFPCDYYLRVRKAVRDLERMSEE
jgi:hypothetical protein